MTMAMAMMAARRWKRSTFDHLSLFLAQSKRNRQGLLHWPSATCQGTIMSGYVPKFTNRLNSSGTSISNSIAKMSDPATVWKLSSSSLINGNAQIKKLKWSFKQPKEWQFITLQLRQSHGEILKFQQWKWNNGELTPVRMIISRGGTLQYHHYN